MKNHLSVPKNGNMEEWQRFIDAEIPLVERTSDERGLLRLRKRAALTLERRARPSRTLPINPARYEGNMGDFLQFAFEHHAMA